jgi:hypothetical protein
MTPSVKPFRVISCAEWGARPAKAAISMTGKPVRAIFHHTAGHAPELGDSGESYREAVAYAKAIQNFHMDSRGWNDTGQNFLITRNGYVFEGRHGSLGACRSGKMVASAHCPGQNDQPGVEIEHNGNESMTPIQHEAAVWLFARLCQWGGFKPSQIKGHRDFYATSCPGFLYNSLPTFRKDVAATLKPPGPKAPLYHIKLLDDEGKAYEFDDVRFPGSKLYEFGLVAHRIKSGWIERK